MDVTERPVHCTDAKREVLYVKDEDKWDKEQSDKPKIRKAIKHVAHKNARLLQEFKEKHPDCTKSESKRSDTYTELMVEAMGGKGSNDEEQESKIIKKVSKVCLSIPLPFNVAAARRRCSILFDYYLTRKSKKFLKRNICKMGRKKHR